MKRGRQHPLNAGNKIIGCLALIIRELRESITDAWIKFCKSQRARVDKENGIRVPSEEGHELFTEANEWQNLRVVFYHLQQRLGGLGALRVVGVVHKVTSGPELAVSVLVVVAAHLLFEGGLMLLQLV